MDKRSLSLDRDIRGRKRARLSDEDDLVAVKSSNRPTLHEIYTKFIEIKKSEGLSQGRLKTLLQDKKLCRFSKEKGYSEFLEDISTSILREWQVHMQEQYVVYQIHVRGGKRQGLAPKTINGRIKTLKHFFNVAIENRLIERNEAAPIKLMKEPIDTVEGLTEDQVKAMLKACMKSKYTGYRDYVFIMLGIDCGLRAGEMITLTARSFDFDIGILKIEEDVSKNQRARIVPRCEVSNEVIAVYEKWKAKEMTAVEAMRKVGMKPNTFYRRVSDLEKERASSL